MWHKTKPKALESQRAFTLVELLCVLVVMVVLFSLLYPAISRSKRAGNSTNCSNNLKQIQIALTQYANDYQDRYPVHHSGVTLGGRQGTLSEMNGTILPNLRPLNSYVNSFRTFECPNDVGIPERTGKLSCKVAYGTSYQPPIGFDLKRVQHTTATIRLDPSLPEATPITQSTIAKSPSNKITIGDLPWWMALATWHNNGKNLVAYGDGSVRLFSYETTSDQLLNLPPDMEWKWW